MLIDATSRNVDPGVGVQKTKTKVTCAYITELSYGSVAKRTFSVQRK